SFTVCGWSAPCEAGSTGRDERGLPASSMSARWSSGGGVGEPSVAAPAYSEPPAASLLTRIATVYAPGCHAREPGWKKTWPVSWSTPNAEASAAVAEQGEPGPESHEPSLGSKHRRWSDARKSATG